MLQVSAVNNARTRRAKADARARNTGNPPAPTSPRKRKQVPAQPADSLCPTQNDHDDSTKHVDTLRKAWLLLEGYLTDKTSASEVSDFLDSVAQPELHQAFADIMGTEDDDHEKRDVLNKMVKANLEELGKGEQDQELPGTLLQHTLIDMVC